MVRSGKGRVVVALLLLMCVMDCWPLVAPMGPGYLPTAVGCSVFTSTALGPSCC